MKQPSQIFRKTSHKLLSIIWIIFFTLILLEIGTRIWINHFASERRFLKYASLKQLQKRYIHSKPIYTPHRYLGHYLTPNYTKDENRHNSLGYRGDEIVLPKPEEQFRIVCMGGSTTYTSEVKNYKMSYPYLLEKQLKSKDYENVSVINSGVGGWSSWETLINFETRVLDLDPDMIIIYHGINDVYPRLVWPPEAYKGDNSGRRTPINREVFMPSILEYSTVMRYLMIRLGLVMPHSAIDRILDIPPDTYYGFQFREQKRRKIYPSGIFANISAEEMLITNRAVYFKRNIENIVLIAKSRGIKVVLSTFAYSALFTEEPVVASEEFVSAIHETNEILKSIASEMGVNLFDFAGVFPVDKDYYTDGRHVNVEGAKLKSTLFMDYLVENNLIPNPLSKIN